MSEKPSAAVSEKAHFRPFRCARCKSCGTRRWGTGRVFQVGCKVSEA